MSSMGDAISEETENNQLEEIVPEESPVSDNSQFVN